MIGNGLGATSSRTRWKQFRKSQNSYLLPFAPLERLKVGGLLDQIAISLRGPTAFPAIWQFSRYYNLPKTANYEAIGAMFLGTRESAILEKNSLKPTQIARKLDLLLFSYLGQQHRHAKIGSRGLAGSKKMITHDDITLTCRNRKK